MKLLKSESHSYCGCKGDYGNDGGWLVADSVGESHTVRETDIKVFFMFFGVVAGEILGVVFALSKTQDPTQRQDTFQNFSPSRFPIRMQCCAGRECGPLPPSQPLNLMFSFTMVQR